MYMSCWLVWIRKMCVQTSVSLVSSAKYVIVIVHPWSPPAACYSHQVTPCWSLWLTDTGDSLCDQVLQESIDNWIVSGVQFISINPNVEAEPVGVGISRQLPCWAELIHVSFSSPGGGRKEREAERGFSGVRRDRCISYMGTDGGLHCCDFTKNKIINEFCTLDVIFYCITASKDIL